MEVSNLLNESGLNMYLAWLLVIPIILTFLRSLLRFDISWILFSGLTLILVVMPAFFYKNPKVMLPWELILLASIPIVVRGFQFSVISSQIAFYISMATLALIISVNLHLFTSVKLNNVFAVGFVVVTTLATVGVWSIIRYVSDSFLGTSYLSTNEDLMAEFLNVAIAGAAAGVLFDSYFRQRGRKLRRKLRKVIRR